MNSNLSVDDFMSQHSFVLAGLSRTGKKFGNYVYNSMIEKGYSVYAIHPEAKEIDGIKCYKDYESLPEKIENLIVVVNKQNAIPVVSNAINNGIKRIWIQQGSSTQEIEQLCHDNKIDFISGHCIMMFSDSDTFPHNFHRWILKVFGKLPD